MPLGAASTSSGSPAIWTLRVSSQSAVTAPTTPGDNLGEGKEPRLLAGAGPLGAVRAARSGAMTDPRTPLTALLMRLDPTVAAKLSTVGDVCELSRDLREHIVDLLGSECADHGLDEHEQLNAYGRELEALIESLGLEEPS